MRAVVSQDHLGSCLTAQTEIQGVLGKQVQLWVGSVPTGLVTDVHLC